MDAHGFCKVQVKKHWFIYLWTITQYCVHCSPCCLCLVHASQGCHVLRLRVNAPWTDPALFWKQVHNLLPSARFFLTSVPSCREINNTVSETQVVLYLPGIAHEGFHQDLETLRVWAGFHCISQGLLSLCTCGARFSQHWRSPPLS